ncbi:DUF6685 family protein [Pseudomonas turukhanskensis]|nr:DUF6685 family protein [Pseudomonas turukhanskensis]
MSSSEPPISLSDRLSALAQRLGLSSRGPRQILQRASSLRLPFQPLPQPPEQIWWQNGAPLQRLVDMPRNALSGPVQEDKAKAHSMLIKVVEHDTQQLNAFDLRLIDGLCGSDLAAKPFAHFEEYASSDACRGVRIISYKDFVKVISTALPRFLAGERIVLRQADWVANRVYWVGEHHHEAFASAIAYARLRGLDVSLPAEITRYRLSTPGLQALQGAYHMLAMPVQAWSDPQFMGLLLDKGLPYARLAMLRTPGAPEFLLLPKDSPEATALGEGLRLAGAPDVVAYLLQLAATITPP